jgi:hypothetical protein
VSEPKIHLLIRSKLKYFEFLLGKGFEINRISRVLDSLGNWFIDFESPDCFITVLSDRDEVVVRLYPVKSNRRLDVIGNKVSGHNLSGFFLRSTRRLCKLQAMTMTKSEKPSLVLRNTSFTHRERLMPAMACSTLTRTLDIVRLFAFSFFVSSFLRGFFSVAPFYRPSVHNLESLCPSARSYVLDKRYFPFQPLSCHGFCLGRSGSDTKLAFS